MGRPRARPRRSKLEIFYNVLDAIESEIMAGNEARPTRIAHLSNMSYDKIARYIAELMEKNMITKKNAISLTAKGRQFWRDYTNIIDFITKISKEYL